MAGRHHRRNEHDLGRTLGDGERQVRPGVLQTLGSQRVRHGCATEHQHSRFAMLGQLLLCSRMNQPCIYTQPLPFEFLSYSGCDRALSRVPCAIYRRLSLVIYFIRRINSVYMCIPISHFLPFPFPPWYPYKRGSENEVNQEGKNKYQLLSHLCGI